MKKIKLIDVYAYLFFIICLSLPFLGNRFYAIPNGINIVLVLTFPFVMEFKRIKTSIYNSSFVFFSLFIVYVLANSLISKDFILDFSIIKKFLQVLLIIILSFPLKYRHINLLKFGLIYGTLIAVIYSLYKIALVIIDTSSFYFSKGPLVNETLPVQRLYLGLFCCISFIFCLDFLFREKKFKRKVFYFLLAFIFAGFVFLISARIAIISIIIVIIFHLFSKTNTKFKLLTLGSIIGLLLIVSLINPNISKRLLHLDDQVRKTYIEKIKIHEPRYLIWKYSYSILNKSNFIFGIGFEDTQRKLIEQYKQISPAKKSKWFVDEEFNTHNQYLDILISKGLVGLIIFLILLYHLFRESSASLSSRLLFLTMIMYFGVYNNFHRIIGVFIFAMVYLIITKSLKNKN